MLSKLIPSHDRFIIHVPAHKATEESVARQLLQFGAVEDLPGTAAVVLHVRSGGSDARAVWERLRTGLDPESCPEPILLDEQGQPHLPTGQVSVRFCRTISDKELKRFAASHKLKLRSRNEFVPEQIVFEPLELAGTYLPEMVDELGKVEGVAAAWPNTLSKFRRIV
ncbi:MAG: hypothetical protein HYZ53_08420 [Planctomycetes bacterium]|nr:hypothetical protein [Planctomycetota bacterium]